MLYDAHGRPNEPDDVDVVLQEPAPDPNIARLDAARNASAALLQAYDCAGDLMEAEDLPGNGIIGANADALRRHAEAAMQCRQNIERELRRAVR